MRGIWNNPGALWIFYRMISTDYLLQCPGGVPANVAVGSARLGSKSAFIGRVGDDPFGRFRQKTLAKEQVDIQWMRRDPLHDRCAK